MLELTLDGLGTRQSQLQRALKALLLAGQVRRLPGTRALAARLGLARNTVIAAYTQLEAEGFLKALPGSGFVARWQRPEAAAAPPGGKADLKLSPLAQRTLGMSVRRPPPRPAGSGEAAPRFDLVYGVPVAAPAFRRHWRQALARAAAQQDLDYPPATGLPRLAAALSGYLGRRRGFRCDASQFVITSGAQQALDLIVRTLAGPDTIALLEDPHYQGTRQVLIAAGVPVRYLPVDDQGLNPAQLPERPDCLLFLTPAHQFPRGGPLSLERRFDILAWAARTGSWVIEDDYDGEFRFDAQPLAALKALDEQAQRVLYVGTLSKALYPALRMGFLVLPAALHEACAAVKWLTDRGNPPLEQLALALLIESGAFERQLRLAGRALAARRAALLAGLDRHCHGQVSVEGQAAGMHLTVWLDRLPATAVPALIRAARDMDLGLYPIAPYFLHPPTRAGLLLGYAGLPPETFDEAMRRLGTLLAQSWS